MSEKLSILLVDDDIAIRGMLSLSLMASYQVLEADSAVSAIDCLQKQPVDLVVLDMGMPPNEHSPEEGLKVLDWIKSSACHTKVVVLTGQDYEKTSYLAIKHGAFDFLSKPVDVESISVALNRAALFLKQASKLKQDEGIQKVELDLAIGEGVKTARNQAEEKLIKQVLFDTDFNVHEVARRLGLKRENVYYLIKKYSIERSE